MDHQNRDRLELLDRIEKRVPDLDLDKCSVEWDEMPDGAPALLVDGGGLDGGSGLMFASAGDDVHAIGSLAPLLDGMIGCIAIRPDGSRVVVRTMPDPLAQPR